MGSLYSKLPLQVQLSIHDINPMQFYQSLVLFYLYTSVLHCVVDNKYFICLYQNALMFNPSRCFHWTLMNFSSGSQMTGETHYFLRQYQPLYDETLSWQSEDYIAVNIYITENWRFKINFFSSHLKKHLEKNASTFSIPYRLKPAPPSHPMTNMQKWSKPVQPVLYL